MKFIQNLPARLVIVVASAGWLSGGMSLQAANAIKLDTTSMATNSVNWSGGSGTAPAGSVQTTQIGEFDNTVSSGSLAAMTLGQSVSLTGIKLDANMNGPLNIANTGGYTLTLGTSGLDMSVANNNCTINCLVACGTTAQTWTINSGETLTVSSSVSFGGGGSLTLAGAGNAILPGLSTGNGTGLIGVTMTGNFTGTDVNIGKTGSTTTTVPTAASPVLASAASGFYVSANANVSLSTLELSTQNGGCSSLISAGSTTVSGAVTVGKSSSGSRGTYFQISGGSFTSSDTVNGLTLAPNNGTAVNLAELYMSGGTTTVGKLNFGASADTVGGTGFFLVKGGSCYIGSGGINRITTIGAYTETVSLFSGLLGAQASWSSSQPVALSSTTGVPFVIQAADASSVAHNIALSGVITGAGTAPLTKTGGGTLTLSGANTFTGIVTNNAGILNAGVAEIPGTSGPFGDQAATAAGTIVFGGGTLQYSGANNADYSGRFSTAAGQPISIDVAGRNVTYATALAGAGTTLTLADSVGGGSLTLSGVTSTYTGTTTINGGTLNVNGSTAAGSAVTVNGGMLGGTGTVNGAVTVNAGGIAPGVSGAGTLTLASSLSLGATSTNNIGFTSTTVNAKASVAGALTVTDTTEFNLYVAGSTTPWTTPGTYNLIQYGSLTGGTLDSTWTTTSGTNPHINSPQTHLNYAFSLSGGYLVLTIGSSVDNDAWDTGLFTGNWSTGGNWTATAGSTPPKNSGDSATFSSDSAGYSVTLDVAETVGSITMNNPNSTVIVSSGATLTLDNTPAAAVINVNAGTANAIQPPVALNDNLNANISAGDQLTLSGAVANGVNGAVTVTNSGAGTLVLSSANSYGPSSASVVGTVMSGAGGTVQAGNNSALSTGALNVAASGTLQAGASGLSLGNNIGVNSGVTLTVNNGGNPMTLSGVISSSGNLKSTGAGTLTLGTANTYTGSTTIGAGVLSLGADTSLGTAPVSATPGSITLSGGDLLGSATFALNANRGVSLTAGGFIDAAASTTLTINGIIAGANNLTVNGSGGSGVVALAGVNTFSGTTVITAGTLTLVNTNALQDSTLNYNNQGGALSFGSLTSATLGGLSGAENLALPASFALSVGDNNNSTYSGGLSGTGATLTKVGAGTLTLTGVNTYTGATTGNAGELEISTGGSITTASVGGQGYLVDGGTLTAAGSSGFNSANNALTETAGAVTLGPVSQGSSAGDGQLISIAGGTFSASSLSFERTVSMTTAPTATAPQAAPTTSGLYVNGGNVDLGSLSISLENSSASARMDAGSLTVTNELLVGDMANNRWTILQINGGTFNELDSNIGVVLSEVNGTSANFSELYLSGGTSTVGKIAFGWAADTAGAVGGTGWLIVNNASLYVGAGGIQQSNTANYSVNISLLGGTLGAAANWSSAQPMQLSGAGFTIQAADASANAHNISLGGVLSGGGGLIKTGAGTLTLSGPNQITGIITNNAGTLNINGSYALGGANYAGLVFDGGALQYAPAFSGNGPGDISQNTAGTPAAKPVSFLSNATIDVNGNAVAYANPVGNSGAGGLTVMSSAPNGSLTLGAANTYAGVTTVNSGTLLVNGSTGAGGVVVSNGTLGGTGTIGGAATNLADAVLAPGIGGIGTLTFSGGLTLSSASTNTFAVTTSGGASNKVVVTGLLTPSNSVVRVTSGTALLPSTNTIFTYGTISGASTFNPAVVFDVAPVHPASLVDDGSGHINLVVPNSPPVAGTASYTRNAGISLRIAVTNLLSNASDPDGDSISLMGVSTTTNGVTLTRSTDYLLYQNANNVNDQFSYTVTDPYGATSSGLVNIVVNNSGIFGQNATVTVGGSSATVSFAGIPGYSYGIQRSTNLIDWVTIVTTNAPANGLFSFTDNFSDLGVVPTSAYYRLQWNP